MRKQNDSDPASVAAEKRKTEREIKERGIVIKKEAPVKEEPMKKTIKKVVKKFINTPIKKALKKKRR